MKCDSQVYFLSNYNCSSEVRIEDASDLIDISMYTEKILMKYLSFPLYISIDMPASFYRYQNKFE